jgi:hypothetical protein
MQCGLVKLISISAPRTIICSVQTLFLFHDVQIPFVRKRISMATASISTPLELETAHLFVRETQRLDGGFSLVVLQMIGWLPKMAITS